MDELHELAVRTALFAHLDRLLSESADDTLDWKKTQSFIFRGETISVRQVRGRGINKPAMLDAALSITTAFTPFGRPPPYEDLVGDDGYPRYKYEGINANSYTNRALRLCLEHELPLAYFVGVRHGVYAPIYPVYVIGDNPTELQFTLAFRRSDFGLVTSGLTVTERRYAMREAKTRLHQPIFREQVLNAYAYSCAVCKLRHAQLLDAAHIISDSKPRGDPIVPNGIALCKIHHAAYDHNLMGIRADYRVIINSTLLEETDGPMLKHGLQEMQGVELDLPRRQAERPDPQRLEIRFEEFLSTG